MVMGQDPQALELFQIMNLKTGTINALWKIFRELDVHSTGTIRPMELYTYFHMEANELEKNILTAFDLDKTGKLNFTEFVCALWIFLSLAESDMADFLYRLKDASGTYCLKVAEVKDLFEMIHHKKVETSTMLAPLYADIKQRFPVELRMEEWRSWVYTQGGVGVIQPLLILQIKMRRLILGEGFWQGVVAYRAKVKQKEREAETSTSVRGSNNNKKPRAGGGVTGWGGAGGGDQIDFFRKLVVLLRSLNEKQHKYIEAMKKDGRLLGTGGSSSGNSEKDKAQLARQNSIFRKAFQLGGGSSSANSNPPSRKSSAAFSDSGEPTPRVTPKGSSAALERGGGSAKKKTQVGVQDAAEEAHLDHVPASQKPRKKSAPHIDASMAINSNNNNSNGDNANTNTSSSNNNSTPSGERPRKKSAGNNVFIPTTISSAEPQTSPKNTSHVDSKGRRKSSSLVEVAGLEAASGASSKKVVSKGEGGVGTSGKAGDLGAGRSAKRRNSIS
eukprot:gene24182-29247_t